MSQSRIIRKKVTKDNVEAFGRLFKRGISPNVMMHKLAEMHDREIVVGGTTGHGGFYQMPFNDRWTLESSFDEGEDVVGQKRMIVNILDHIGYLSDLRAIMATKVGLVKFVSDSLKLDKFNDLLYHFVSDCQHDINRMSIDIGCKGRHTTWKTFTLKPYTHDIYAIRNFIADATFRAAVGEMKRQFSPFAWKEE